MNKKLFAVVLIILLSFSIVLAANFWVDINMNLKNIYNATWVNSTKFNGTYYGDGQYLTGIAGGAGNTTEEMQDAVMDAIDAGTQTRITVTYQDATNDMDFVVDNMVEFNTTSEMRAAINNTPGTFNITVNNSVYFNGKVTSFFQNGTEIDTANTTAQMRAAVNGTGLYYDFEVNTSQKLDNLDSTHFYPNNKTMENATLFKDNVKAYFGTDYDFKIYFNGTHLYIGP